MNEVRKKEEEKRKNIEIPEELEKFKSCKIYNDEEMDKMKELKVEKLRLLK